MAGGGLLREGPSPFNALAVKDVAIWSFLKSYIFRWGPQKDLALFTWELYCTCQLIPSQFWTSSYKLHVYIN